MKRKSSISTNGSKQIHKATKLSSGHQQKQQSSLDGFVKKIAVTGKVETNDKEKEKFINCAR